MGSSYVDVVIFALVAVFIGLRLRSVLGRRTGNERPPQQFGPLNGRPNGQTNGVVTPLRPVPSSRPAAPIIESAAIPAGDAADGDAVSAGLARIQAIDPSITADSFLGGARAAFEMILHAFAQGDETALQPLLSDEVFQNFAKVIRTRREAGETCENQIMHIVSADMVDADLVGKFAHITIRFVSQQVIVVKDTQGAVVEGDPAKTAQVTDLWTFARDPRSRDPNWALVATRSQDE